MAAYSGPWHSVSPSACAHIACPVLADRFFRWCIAADPPRAPLLDESLAHLRPFGIFVSFRRARVLPGDATATSSTAFGRWAVPHLGLTSEAPGTPPPGPSPVEAPVAAMRAALRVLLEDTPGLVSDPGASLQLDFMHDPRAVQVPETGPAADGWTPSEAKGSHHIELPDSLFVGSSSSPSSPCSAGSHCSGVPPRHVDSWSAASGSPDSTSTLPFDLEWDETPADRPPSPSGAASSAPSAAVPQDPGAPDLHPASGQPAADPDGPRGYLLIGTGPTRLTFVPQPAAGVRESEQAILTALAAHLARSNVPERPLHALSFAVRRFSAPLFDIVRLLWRTSIGRGLRRNLSDFLRDHWVSDLPPLTVHVGSRRSDGASPSLTYEPADIVRNARIAARGLRLERLVREESGRGQDSGASGRTPSGATPSGAAGPRSGLAPQGPRPSPEGAAKWNGEAQGSSPATQVARFADAFAPVAALDTRLGLALSHAAALLLRVRGPAALPEAWARSATACVQTVLVRSRMQAQAAYDMLGGLAAAEAAIPEEAGMWLDLRPNELDLPGLVARTLLATSPHAETVARQRPLGAAPPPSVRALAAVWERWCAAAMDFGKPGRLFSLFATEELTGVLLALSHLPPAVLGPGLRAAWIAMLGEACRRWLPALPFLVARPGKVRASIEESLSLALSSAV